MTALMLIPSVPLALLLGYALGSIPFGLLLTRWGGAGDIRTIGSGNIGTTNVLRTGRKDLAAATLLLDAGKGAAAVFAAEALWPGTGMWAGLGALVGHIYPLWLKFRGGKGVATMLGVAAALAWPLGLAFALVWLGAALVTRYSSVGGMAGAVAAPIAAFATARHPEGFALAAMAALVIWKHRDNLGRLRAGTESRIGAKAAPAHVRPDA